MFFTEDEKTKIYILIKKTMQKEDICKFSWKITKLELQEPNCSVSKVYIKNKNWKEIGLNFTRMWGCKWDHIFSEDEFPIWSERFIFYNNVFQKIWSIWKEDFQDTIHYYMWDEGLKVNPSEIKECWIIDKFDTFDIRDYYLPFFWILSILVVIILYFAKKKWKNKFYDNK